MGRSPPVRTFVKAAKAASERRADERAVFAVDDTADAGAGRC